MLALYGAWGIFAAVTGPGPYDEQIAAGGMVAEKLEPIAAMHVAIAVVVYAGVIAGGLVSTASAAIYYFTRRRHIVEHLERTPAWVVETLRTVEG